MSLRNITHVLFKRKRTFLLSALVPPLLCAVIVLPKASIYESTAAVMVKVADEEFVTPDGLTDQQGRSANSAPQLAKQIISGAQLIMTSGDVYKSALTRVGIKRVYPRIEEQAAKSKVPPLEMAMELFEKDLDVKVSGDTNVLLLTMANTDPLVAQATLKEVLQAAIEKQASVTRDPRTEFLDRKLTTLRAESNSARGELLAFKQRSKITAFDEERTLLLRQRDDTQLQLSRTRAEWMAAQGRSGALQGTLAVTPEEIALSDENDRSQRTLEQAQQRLSSASSRYESAQRRYTADNPELADIEADYEAAKKDMAQASQASMVRVRKGINPLAQQISGGLSTARSDANAFKVAAAERERQLVEINKRLQFLDASELELRELEQRVALTDSSYRSYQRRAESARILHDMNEAGISSLNIMQAPTRAYVAARPKKKLLMALSILAGIIAAFAVCILRETLDDTISFPEQLQDTLGLPVMASIKLKKAA